MAVIDLVNKLYSSDTPLYKVLLTFEVLATNTRFKATNTRAATIDKTEVQFVKAFAYLSRADQVGFQLLVTLHKDTEVEIGDLLTYEGTLYNYEGIPLLGYEKANPKSLLPARAKSTTNINPKYGLPIPIFTFYDENITLLPISKYPTSWDLKELNIDTSTKDMFMFSKKQGFAWQTEFNDLKTFINHPVIQIVNGYTKPDKISIALLDYLTDKEWLQVTGLIEHRNYNKGPKVLFLQTEDDANLDFPIINILSI